MPYLILFISLLIIEFIYIRVAGRLNISAPVTSRSSHSATKPTGGGIIFILAIAAFFFNRHAELNSTWWYVTAGAAVLSLISFIDDIKPLSPTLRLIVHAVVVTAAFSYLVTPPTFHIYLMFLICGVGLINAINFIDGIACMLAFYSIIALLTLGYGFYEMGTAEAMTHATFALITLIAVLAFTVFNIPDKVFAGDVGAITVGFVITFLLFQFMIDEREASSLVFVNVCVCDVGLTTTQRLFEGKNILLPHRSCIYQVLTSKWGLPHLAVSSSYALVQAVINIGYFLIPDDQSWSYAILTTLGLTVLYFIIRQQTRHRFN